MKNKTKLTNTEKRTIEAELVMAINLHPNGINTRNLISIVMAAISSNIPNATRRHVSGMLSWVWKKYGYTFLVRTPGYSIIA